MPPPTAAPTGKATIGRRSAAGRRSRVSPDRIARAALRIVDREGLGALTMRRVAESLGVGTMTLYGHFRNKQELLDAVVDAAIGADDPPASSGPWQGRLRDLTQLAHRNLSAHPGLVQIRLAAPVLRPDALRFGEAGMGILRDAGFPAGDAAYAFRLLFTYVFGFAALDSSRLGDARRRTAAAIAGLPEHGYPNLVEASHEFSEAIGGEEAFDRGLELIIEGLGSRLDRTKEQLPGPSL